MAGSCELTGERRAMPSPPCRLNGGDGATTFPQQRLNASGGGRAPETNARPTSSTYSLCWTGLIPLLACVVVVPVAADEPSASAATSAIVTHS